MSAAARLPRLLLALALALGAAGCGKSPKLSPLAPQSVVLAFGDSLTFGTGAAESESYPAQLQALIGRSVVREGVPGEVSAAGLARLPEALEAHQPALLLLCHGGNDFLRRMPKSQVAENLRAMIRLAKSRGADVVLIGTPEPGFTVTPPEFYEEIAGEFRIPYEGSVIGRILRAMNSRCQASSLVCRSSRTASSSRLRGARSAMTEAAPAQKASASTPVPGNASLLMKSCRTVATCNPLTVIRSDMAAFLERMTTHTCYSSVTADGRRLPPDTVARSASSVQMVSNRVRRVIPRSAIADCSRT